MEGGGIWSFSRSWKCGIGHVVRARTSKKTDLYQGCCYRQWGSDSLSSLSPQSFDSPPL